MLTPEGRVRAKLKRHLARDGLWSFWPVQTGYGAATVDCLCAYPPHGHLIAIECKREGVTKPTPRQAAVMRAMRKVGIETYVVTMKDGELLWLEQKGQ